MRYRLGDVCSRLSSGKTISASAVADAGLYPVYGANGLRGYTNSSNFKGQCALIGRQGAYCGNVKYFSGEGYITEHAVVLQANGLADTQYLAYRLSILDLGRLSGQSAQPGLSVKDLANQIVDLPSLDVQRSVANLLSALDRKIALNRRKIATLEKMAKEIYDYWFVQYDFPDANGRPYKSSGGEMVYSPELKREIPKGWKVGDFSELIDFTMGQSPAGTTLNEDGKGCMFFQGATDFGPYFPMPRQYTSSPVRMARTGDVLLSVRAPVGTLNFASDDCCIGRGLGAFRGKSVSNLFVWFYLKSLKSYFDSKNAAGTTFGSIGKDDFKILKTVVPPESILSLYSDYAEKVFNSMRLCSGTIMTDIRLRDFLLPLLMNGQVRIGGADE